MPIFFIHIRDGKEAEVEIEVEDALAAVNSGYNALAIFVCRNFPPPDEVAISVCDATPSHIASLKLSFEIRYARGFVS